MKKPASRTPVAKGRRATKLRTWECWAHDADRGAFEVQVYDCRTLAEESRSILGGRVFPVLVTELPPRRAKGRRAG